MACLSALRVHHRHPAQLDASARAEPFHQLAGVLLQYEYIENKPVRQAVNRQVWQAQKLVQY
jgi:hypothetical protein